MLEISNYLELFVDAVTFRAPQNWCLGFVISLLVLWPSLSRQFQSTTGLRPERFEQNIYNINYFKISSLRILGAHLRWSTYLAALLDQILGHINEITRKKFASVVGEASGIFQELRSDGWPSGHEQVLRNLRWFAVLEVVNMADHGLYLSKKLAAWEFHRCFEVLLRYDIHPLAPVLEQEQERKEGRRWEGMIVCCFPLLDVLSRDFICLFCEAGWQWQELRIWSFASFGLEIGLGLNSEIPGSKELLPDISVIDTYQR